MGLVVEDARGLHSVFRFDDIKVAGEHVFKQGAVHLRIIHNEDFFSDIHSVASFLSGRAKAPAPGLYSGKLFFLYIYCLVVI